jgi:ATP-binding cassette subfamily B protein
VFYVASQYFASIVQEIRGVVYGRAERRMMRTLNERLFAHLLRLPLQFHLSRHIGGITQSLSNGQQGFQTTTHILMFSILPAIFELVTIVVVVRTLHMPVLFMLFSASILGYALVFTYAARSTVKVARRATEAQVAASGIMTDSLMNCEIVKHCAAEAAMERRVGAVFGQTESAWVDYYRQFARNGILAQSVNAAFKIATILYAVHKLRQGEITIGTFVLVNTYALQIVRPIEMLGYAVQLLSQGIAYLLQTLDLLREQPENLLAGASVSTGRGRIVFEGIEARYGNSKTILENVSFEVPAGSTVAIVGRSGSGKSTLGRLLTRMIEPVQGRILLDGVPITSLQLAELRSVIAVVPQDTILFNDTIAFNIGFGKQGSTEREIEVAARRAHLHEFISKLQNGYETVVGERGLMISGGERQRVAIARAVIQKPRVYLWDEATSSLDSTTEREILRNIAEVGESATTIMIAHRLSTVVHADQIIVLNEGRVVERGTHDELLRRNGQYATLWWGQQRGHGGICVGGVSPVRPDMPQVIDN